MFRAKRILWELTTMVLGMLGVAGALVGLWFWAFLRPDLLVNPGAISVLAAPEMGSWHRSDFVSLLRTPFLSEESALAEIEYFLVRSGFSYWTINTSGDTLTVTHILPGKAAIPVCGQNLFVDVVIRDRQVTDVVGSWVWTCV
jgi:hypothetical protein